jgi:hypothetical protein
MSLQKKTQVWNKDYPSMVTIISRGKDPSPNGLGDGFENLWFKDLVHVQAIHTGDKPPCTEPVYA